MAMKIGEFFERGSWFEGTIKTRLLSDLGHVRIDPLMKPEDSGSGYPDYLVKADGFEIGKAWKQMPREGDREYLNVLLDDPHMPQPIYARLVAYNDHHILLWERGAE